MASKVIRPVVGLAALFTTVVFSWPALAQSSTQPASEPTGSLSTFQVSRDSKGRWLMDFDYVLAGDPQFTGLQPYLTVRDASGNERQVHARVSWPVVFEQGSHHLTVELLRPMNMPQQFTSTLIAIELRGMILSGGSASKSTGSRTIGQSGIGKVLARAQIDRVIEWPDEATWQYERQFVEKTPDQLLDEAIAGIDSAETNYDLEQPRNLLEHLINSNPELDQAYVELARITMKSNWSPEGFHQAERLIQSALQINPESANAKILLGYIYAHQRQHKLAERLFAEASNTDTTNLWLWANWGESLVMRGKIDQGIEKYRQAILRPRSKPTYDRARLDAYRKLIALLEKRGDMEGVETMYKQRAEEFGAGNCYYAAYGKFVLQQHGDAARAIELARNAMDSHCRDVDAREVLGMAHYVAWASAVDADGAKFLNQAHVFLPVSPRSIYLLSTSSKTVGALQKLIKSGESIDQRDSRNWNALSLSLRERDHDAVMRLLRLGARADALVGEDSVPVALLPVIQRDLDGIKLLRRSGVDYRKLKYQGVSVLEQVRRSGDRELINALDSKASST